MSTQRQRHRGVSESGQEKPPQGTCDAVPEEVELTDADVKRAERFVDRANAGGLDLLGPCVRCEGICWVMEKGTFVRPPECDGPHGNLGNLAAGAVANPEIQPMITQPGPVD